MQKRDLINPRQFLLQTSRFLSLFPRDNPHLHSLSLFSHFLNDSYDSHFSKPTFKPFSELGFRRTPDVGVGSSLFRGFILPNFSKNVSPFGSVSFDPNHSQLSFHRNLFTRSKEKKRIEVDDQHSQRAVTTALFCNFLVFCLKLGVWFGTSSHVMLAEAVHSLADFANQALLAYGLTSSRRGADALHNYGYLKERFVWSLISAVGIFCLGAGATIVDGIQNLCISEQPQHIEYAGLVILGSLIVEGGSLAVAINAVQKNAAAEGMNLKDYIWCGHDPTAVAVMTEASDWSICKDGAAVAGLVVAGASLLAVNATGNAIYDPIGSIFVGNILGMVAIFLIQRNRHALIGRAMDDRDTEKIIEFLENDLVVEAVYDCKSEIIGPGFFRFKAEVDFNGVVVVQNFIKRAGYAEWIKQMKSLLFLQLRDAAKEQDNDALLKVMSNYGEEVVTAIGEEVDRLETEIQRLVPGIRHVDIEVHNPSSFQETPRYMC
ncbi:hypothetical protein Cgig2_028970 [Carnegiea gigantea]|uniref:Cation efflux protein transmembrane domain-containing protein n=1 Tax=Carnegiea gigantea TaxID=171969 RepID=A0A9Q1JVD1_9CARY|nr:hypothetical protein Cgig2_028970 [Carnegiea gigantea]